METVSTKPTFATRFRELCSIADQAALAEKFGVTKNAFRQWKNGNSMPTTDRLINLASYFQVTTDYLLGLTDTKSPDLDIQAAVKRFGLAEETLQALEHWQKENAEITLETVNHLLANCPGVIDKIGLFWFGVISDSAIPPIQGSNCEYIRLGILAALQTDIVNYRRKIKNL
jgi:transcriptional regulator with XRE-family HTH domain